MPKKYTLFDNHEAKTELPPKQERQQYQNEINKIKQQLTDSKNNNTLNKQEIAKLEKRIEELELLIKRTINPSFSTYEPPVFAPAKKST